MDEEPDRTFSLAFTSVVGRTETRKLIVIRGAALETFPIVVRCKNVLKLHFLKMPVTWLFKIECV